MRVPPWLHSKGSTACAAHHASQGYLRGIRFSTSLVAHPTRPRAPLPAGAQSRSPRRAQGARVRGGIYARTIVRASSTLRGPATAYGALQRAACVRVSVGARELCLGGEGGGVLLIWTRVADEPLCPTARAEPDGDLCYSDDVVELWLYASAPLPGCPCARA